MQKRLIILCLFDTFSFISIFVEIILKKIREYEVD